MKVCISCRLELPLSDFYKHSQMADGHLGKCKSCCKNHATANRNKNIDRIRAYDRERGSRQTKEYAQRYKTKYPNKYKAHNMVNNAIRDKKLFREPCFCGKKGKHAHHNDYLKPLNVLWMCAACHSQWHRDNGEALNP